MGVDSDCTVEAEYNGVRVGTDCDDAGQNVQTTDIGASIGAGADVADLRWAVQNLP